MRTPKIDNTLRTLFVSGGPTVLGRRQAGLITGFVFTDLSIIRWLFYITVSPLLAIVIIVIDGLVIYGLAKHADYFQGSPRAGVDVAELERLAQVLDEGLEMLSVLPRHL